MVGRRHPISEQRYEASFLEALCPLSLVVILSHVKQDGKVFVILSAVYLMGFNFFISPTNTDVFSFLLKCNFKLIILLSDL